MRDTDSDSKLTRLRRRWPWLDHVIRAGSAYTDRYGNHYAAAITYFSVLSLFPLMMIAFSVAGFVLATRPDLLVVIKQSVVQAAPGSLGTTINEVVEKALASKGEVGIFGLLAALYSGVGWMSNLRDALTAQWGHQRQDRPLVSTTLKDLAALVGLGIALLVSFGLTAAGGDLGPLLLRLVGLDGVGWARTLLLLLTLVLSLVANWLVFLWVLVRLPRERVGARSAIRGAVGCAVGFEILKQVSVIYLSFVTRSPAFAVFGPVIGLLLFANLIARFVLFMTAWTATARENLQPTPIQPPAPAVVRLVTVRRQAPTMSTVAGLVGVGAALAGISRLVVRAARRKPLAPRSRYVRFKDRL